MNAKVTTGHSGMRPLTERQEAALCLLAFLGSPTASTEGRMPGLIGRGLAERYWRVSGGIRRREVRITEAGLAEAERIRVAHRAVLESR